MENGTPKQPNKAVIAVVVIALLAIIAAAVILLGKKESPASTNSENAPSVSTDSAGQGAPQTATAENTSGYKNGTYKATGTYRSPGGTETVDLTVTLGAGVVVNAELATHPSTRDAEDYQGRFKSGYKALVVGKKIDDISLSRVAGSSLTSGGFNQALEQIKNDAKA